MRSPTRSGVDSRSPAYPLTVLAMKRLSPCNANPVSVLGIVVNYDGDAVIDCSCTTGPKGEIASVKHVVARIAVSGDTVCVRGSPRVQSQCVCVDI